VAYSTETVGEENRFFISETSSANAALSGRVVHWVFEIEEVASKRTWIIFGSGLGRFAEWIPRYGDTGGYYRTANTNGLLAAWVPFGIFGLLLYVYFCCYTWRRISRAESSPYRSMAVSMFLAYLFTDQFETHWQGTAMLWYVSFILYLFTLARPRLLPLFSVDRRGNLLQGSPVAAAR
jgi:hypothetical protein